MRSISTEFDRVAFAGDWHMNTDWANHAVMHAARLGAGAIIHTGDFGFTYHKSFVDSLTKISAKHDLPVYFIDGNHDNHQPLFDLPLDDEGFGVLTDQLRYIPRGKHWSWRGIEFVGLGGAVSVDRDWRTPMVDWWPTEKISAADSTRTLAAGHADIMVTHDCPFEVPIPGIIENEDGTGTAFPAHAILESRHHRKRLSEIVKQVNPKILVHGHYHTAYASYEGNRWNKGLAEDATSMDKNLWIASYNELAELCGK